MPNTYSVVTDLEELDTYWRAGLLFYQNWREQWEQDTAPEPPSEWVKEHTDGAKGGGWFGLKGSNRSTQFAVMVEE